ERANRPPAGGLQPAVLVLRRRDARQQADVRPGEAPVIEGGVQPRQSFEPPHDGREALKLASREPQPLSRIVIDPAEAELMATTAAKERVGQATEDRTAAAVLRRQTAEPAVEHQRRVVVIEAARVRVRWNEQLGRDDLASIHRQANNSRKSHRWQAT